MQLQEIAERCQQGDRKAFALLYTATRQQLRAVCLRYVQDETVADDVLHDTFLLIFSKIGELKDTKRTEAWLNMVARRMALLYLRQQKQQRQVPLSSCAATSLQSLTVENHGKSLLALSEILAAVDALPDGYRQVFRLSVLDGMTHQEIATLLNIEPHSSSSQLARAKQMLQRIISKYWVVLLLLFVPVGYWLMYRKNRSQLTGDSSRVIAVTDTTSSASSDEPTAIEREQRRVSEVADRKAKSRGAGCAEVTVGLECDNEENPSPFTLHPSSQTDSTTVEPLPLDSRGYAQRTPGEESTPVDSTLKECPFTLHPSSTTLHHWTIDLAYNGQWSMVNGQWSMQLPYADAETNPGIRDSISHHHLPLTVALSVGYRLNHHWQVGTGLSYTRLISDFCSGNSYVSLQQHQTVQYLGIPVSITYLSPLTSRFSLLFSASTTLHLPLRSTLESHYLLPDGTKAESATQSLYPGAQWSAGVGVGVQYDFVPHVSFFIEPSLQHYFHDASNVSTWNTDHPFVFSVPFGLTITF